MKTIEERADKAIYEPTDKFGWNSRKIYIEKD